MKFAIVVSKKDEAGMNIARELKKLEIDFISLDEISIYADKEVDKKCGDAELVIFATKHESEKKIKSLSVHAPGNWGRADFGGVDEKVCKTSAVFMKSLFCILADEIENHKLIGYELTMECTHHGPLIEKPCCFIEIGSSLDEWNDPGAAEVIARTIKRALTESSSNKKSEPVIIIGGPHYCPNFNKIQLNSKYAIGHVIPQYALPLTKEMVCEAVDKTIEPVKKAIIDWKGCGVSSEREEVIKSLKNCGLEILRSDQVFK